MGEEREQGEAAQRWLLRGEEGVQMEKVTSLAAAATSHRGAAQAEAASGDGGA